MVQSPEPAGGYGGHGCAVAFGGQMPAVIDAVVATQGGVWRIVIAIVAESPVESEAVTVICSGGYGATAEALHCAEVKPGCAGGGV